MPNILAAAADSYRLTISWEGNPPSIIVVEVDGRELDHDRVPRNTDQCSYPLPGPTDGTFEIAVTLAPSNGTTRNINIDVTDVATNAATHVDDQAMLSFSDGTPWRVRKTVTVNEGPASPS